MKFDVIELEMGKLELKPGDVLAIRTKRRVPTYVQDHIEQCIKGKLPDGVGCIVLAGDVELTKITQEDLEQ